MCRLTTKLLLTICCIAFALTMMRGDEPKSAEQVRQQASSRSSETIQPRNGTIPIIYGSGTSQVNSVVAPVKPAVPTLPRIPRTAVELALADMRTWPAAIQLQRRYIWLPNGSREEAAIARLDLNIAVSHSPVDYAAAGDCQRCIDSVDLAALCPDKKDFDHALKLWNYLSNIEPYFHGRAYAGDGTFTVNPALHLGKAGIELEQAVGNANPETSSFCPIVRFDWFNKISLTNINGGIYYNFRGLTAGKTTLAEYLKDRGVDLKRSEKKNSENRIGLHSKVTGSSRAINFYTSSDVPPAFGSAIVAVTDDYAEDDHSNFRIRSICCCIAAC